MQQPLVSILLPVYNAEKFLRQTLDSLINQTFSNIEIIAVNDGSTDSSQQILKEYAKRDSRIRVIEQKNSGIVKALNYAASLANGAYIARMDADDISLPRRIELQLAAFKSHQKAVLVAGSFDVMNEDEEHLYHESVPTESEDILRALSVRNPIAHGSVMMKKEIFNLAGGYSPDCGPTEDYELWSRIVAYGELVAIPATLLRWRLNPGSITQKKSNIIGEHMKINLAKYNAQYAQKVVGRSYLMERSSYYVHTYALHGVGMKHMLLKDCMSIAMLFIRNKHYFMAAHQILILASTGRTGLRVVKERLNDTSRYYLNSYIKLKKIGKSKQRHEETAN